MKKTELDPDVTYILCPDWTCNKFFETGIFICESQCPKIEEMKKIIRCFSCGEIIELPGNHRWMLRVDCKCGAQNFQRMTGNYHIIRERPE